MSTAVQSGEIWKLRKSLRIVHSRGNDPAYRRVQEIGEFVFIREALPYASRVHSVRIDADHGIWVPFGDGASFYCRNTLIEDNGVRYDYAERYLHDGHILVSLDPNRRFDMPPRG